MKNIFKILSGLISDHLAFDDKDGKNKWITMNGTPVKVDGEGEALAGPSNILKTEKKQAQPKSIEEKRISIKDAMQKIASGSKEETIANLRNDLEQYGGTNDVTLELGDAKGGLTHIIEGHGAGVLPGVLEAVIDGKILRAPKVNGMVHKVTLEKGDYEAVLSLNKHGKKKTWLLTGFNTTIPKGQKMDTKQAPVGDSKFSPRHVPTQTRPMFSRPSLGADASFNSIVAQIFQKANLQATIRDRIAFDSTSQRRIDENGFLHVSLCHISKETVNEYYGSEIPGWQELNLEPNKIYKGYRSGAELSKAASTFNGLPLLNEHVKDSADDPQKELRVGNLGTAAVFNSPYLNNSLIIQDAEAIEALNPSDPDKAPKRELSASYRYDPVFTAGIFKDQRYDFIMTNIRGNHVALVEEGRAGSDVVVSDSNTINTIKPRGKKMDRKEMFEKFLSALGGGSRPPIEDEDKANVNDKTVEDNEPEAEDSDFADKLMAHLEGLEDQDLALKLKEIIEAVKSAGLSTDEDPDQEKEIAKDTEEEEDKTAMDAKNKTKRTSAKGKNGNVYTFNMPLAMDEKAIATRVEAGIKAKVLAAREVRPLIGDLDPMSFDSAAGIYQKALTLIGKPSKIKDTQALKELCAFACDAKRSNAQYPVLSALFGNDSKGTADPNFENLIKIRQA